ncbi:hypothetical protein IAE37_000122 [Pseudomonas sp. S31]|nr:hypothetical protein [Pseudomonas sp. S31]
MPLAIPDIVKEQLKADSDSGVLLRSVATLMSSTVAGVELMKKDLENLAQVKEEGKKLTELKRRLELRIKDIDREALTLVTENIESPQGGTLKLSWQGLKGHVRLKDIKDGNRVLVQVRHSADPVLEGSIDSTITVWPDTPECFVVKLDITNCLLRTLTYSSRPQANTFDKRVHFNYGLSPILDYVLIGVAEDDGSLEVVDYEHGQLTARKDKEPRFELYKSSPRVALHTIVPGGHQPNVHHAWKWEGGQSITAAIRYQHAPVGSDLQYVPFTRWEWSSNDKGHLQLHQQIDEIPGEQRRTTRHVYQTDSSVPSHLRRAQQTKQIVTLEDLRASKPAEEQQP